MYLSNKPFIIDKHNYYDSLEKMRQAIERKERLTEFLRWFNTFLLAAIILLSFALVFDMPSYSQAENTFEASKDELDLDIEEISPSVKPLSYYQEPVLKRNIFQSSAHQAQKLLEQKKQGIDDLKSRLRVVGIILDDDPQAIIEKVKAQETIFISKGGTIEDAVVLDILEDKVIFLYNDIEVELFQ